MDRKGCSTSIMRYSFVLFNGFMVSIGISRICWGSLMYARSFRFQFLLMPERVLNVLILSDF